MILGLECVHLPMANAAANCQMQISLGPQRLDPFTLLATSMVYLGPHAYAGQVWKGSLHSLLHTMGKTLPTLQYMLHFLHLIFECPTNK